MVRLTLIDVNKIPIAEKVIKFETFTKEYVYKFLKVSLKCLDLNTIITDGHPAYPNIIKKLGAKHQKCIFHKMKNLMDPLLKYTRIRNRKIKNKTSKIKENEEKIEELRKKIQRKTWKNK